MCHRSVVGLESIVHVRRCREKENLPDHGRALDVQRRKSLGKKTINKMTTQIRPQAKRAIDAAIAAGVQPKSGRSGIGLSLAIPNARFRAIYSKNGLTPAGKYYYEKTGIEPPGRFDYTQDAVRREAEVNTSNFWTVHRKR